MFFFVFSGILCEGM